MTLVATAGAHNANSFLTLPEAKALLVGRPGAEVLTAEHQTYLQEAWLIQATALLARRVGWFDERANPLELVAPIVQALPLPMVDQVDAYGELLPGVIPPLVKEATALLALALAQESATSFAGLSALEQLKIGNVEVRVRATTALSPRQQIPREVWDLLGLYGRVPLTGRHMPVVRGQG